MKYLRLTPNFFQYTAMTLAPRAIGYKGVVDSKAQRFSSHPLADLQVYDKSSGLKEEALAYERYTQVFTLLKKC